MLATLDLLWGQPSGDAARDEAAAAAVDPTFVRHPSKSVH